MRNSDVKWVDLVCASHLYSLANNISQSQDFNRDDFFMSMQSSRFVEKSIGSAIECVAIEQQ